MQAGHGCVPAAKRRRTHPRRPCTFARTRRGCVAAGAPSWRKLPDAYRWCSLRIPNRGIYQQSSAIEPDTYVAHLAVSGALRNAPARFPQQPPTCATHQTRSCRTMEARARCATTRDRPGEPATYPAWPSRIWQTRSRYVPATTVPSHAPGTSLHVRENSGRMCGARAAQMTGAARYVPGSRRASPPCEALTCNHVQLNQIGMSHTRGLLASGDTHPPVPGGQPHSPQHTRSEPAGSGKQTPDVSHESSSPARPPLPLPAAIPTAAP